MENVIKKFYAIYKTPSRAYSLSMNKYEKSHNINEMFTKCDAVETQLNHLAQCGKAIK